MLSCTSTYSTFFTTSRPAKAFSFASETLWSCVALGGVESRESRRIAQLSCSGVVGAVFYNVVPRIPQVRTATTTRRQQPLLCVRRYLRAGWETPARQSFGTSPGIPGHGGLSSKSTVFPSWFCCSDRTLFATASANSTHTHTPYATPPRERKSTQHQQTPDLTKAHFGRWPGTASPAGQHSFPASAQRASLRSTQSCGEDRHRTAAHHSDSLILLRTSAILLPSYVARHGPPSTPDSTSHQDPSLNSEGHQLPGAVNASRKPGLECTHSEACRPQGRVSLAIRAGTDQQASVPLKRSCRAVFSAAEAGRDLTVYQQGSRRRRGQAMPSSHGVAARPTAGPTQRTSRRRPSIGRVQACL